MGNHQSEDTCCTLVPYFRIHDGKLDEFKSLCARFIEKTRNDEKCLHYAFSFDGNDAHCREGYTDADAMLAHLESVSDLLAEAFKIANVTRVEIHAPPDEVEKLREPLADFQPQFYTVECGFRA